MTFSHPLARGASIFIANDRDGNEQRMLAIVRRAGVSAGIAERRLGHVIAGVLGTYDRRAYFDEKKRALEDLTTSCPGHR